MKATGVSPKVFCEQNAVTAMQLVREVSMSQATARAVIAGAPVSRLVALRLAAWSSGRIDPVFAVFPERAP